MPIEYWRSVSRLGQLGVGILNISGIIVFAWKFDRFFNFIANCQLQIAKCKLNKLNHLQLITREPYSILAEAAKNIAE
jgi:hypothetical protein